MRIHFKDRGQDFLWWDLDENGKCIDAGPFQASIWTGYEVIDHTALKVGDHICCITKQGDNWQCLYPLTRIEP